MGAEAEYKMKIVVADDEILARKAIASMLLRSDIPVEIVGEFDSGSQVLDYLNKTDGDVDILITDIRMMDIDGLETSRCIMEKKYRTQVILVSGYAEFSYAKQAIQYQVKDYLTKPIEQAALLDAVNRIISRKKQQEISKNRQKEEDILEFSKQQLSVRQLVCNEKLLNRLIENVPENSVWQKYRLAVIQINDNNEEQQKKMHELLKKWQVLHVVQTVLWHFPTGHEWVLVLSDQCKALSENEIRMLMNSIAIYIGFQVNFRFTVGISDIMSGESEFITAYKSAIDAINLRLIKGWNEIFFYSDIENDSTVLFTEGQKIGLKKELQKNNTNRVNEIVHGLFNDKRLMNLKSLDPLYQGIADILSTVSIYSAEAGNIWGNIGFSAQERSYDLYRFYSMVELENFIIGQLEKCMSVPFEESNDASGIVDTVIKYVQENYQQQISLQELAEQQLFMNASYLSRLFKATTGETFSKYLLTIRLKEAAELLKNSGLRISEIGEYVGFSDSSYFISCFRKQFHMTPKEFRHQ